MPFKFNFFASPIESDHKLNWESLCIELSLGIICAAMALYGWQTGMALMAYPAAVVALLCFGLLSYSLISFILEKKKTQINDQRGQSNLKN